MTERPPVSARRRRPAEVEVEEAAPAPRRRSRATEEDEIPSRKRGRGDDDDETPRSRRKRREEEPEEPEEEQEAPEVSDEPRSERRRKKKRKRRLRPLPDEDEEGPAWPWWAFGGGGIALVMFVLLCLTLFLKFDNPLKGYAAYMLIMVPISTVIFFGAMFLSSVLVGAMEIGEIHVAVVKAFILVFLVDLVMLLPFGRFLALIVLLAGLFSLFRLDMWEARMVVFFNWALNFGINWILMAAIFSWAARAGSARDDDGGRPGPAGQPDQGAFWDPEEHGGVAEYDGDDELVALSFRTNKGLRDADLAHMKGFSRLARLDLTGTSITDVGLAQLKPCKGLQQLILTKTKVTDEGVRDLQQALPRLRIMR